jgi:septin family protein
LLDLAVTSKLNSDDGARLVVLPVLSKGDTYTTTRRRKTKEDTTSLITVAELGKGGIWSVISPDDSNETEEVVEGPLEKLAAVCASLSPSPPPASKDPYARLYPWGTCHPLDPAHSDTSKVVEWVRETVAEVSCFLSFF